MHSAIGLFSPVSCRETTLDPRKLWYDERMLRVAFSLALLLFWPPAVLAAPASYDLEKDKSVVGFTWFFGADPVKGTMPVRDAELVIDFDHVENSRVAVSVDVANAKAGFPFADQAMKGPKVLWVEQYPTIVFESQRVRRAGDGAEIDGLLTVRGVTQPVTFAAQLYRQRGTEEGERDRMSIVVTGDLSRSAFGATGWSDAVGDTVSLTILTRIRLSK